RPSLSASRDTFRALTSPVTRTTSSWVPRRASAVAVQCGSAFGAADTIWAPNQPAARARSSAAADGGERGTPFAVAWWGGRPIEGSLARSWRAWAGGLAARFALV